MKKLLLFILILNPSIIILSQTVEFSICPDAYMTDVIDMIRTNDGNYVIAGNKHYATVTSVSSSGDILWNRYLGGWMEWYANISQKSNGNILVPMKGWMCELNPAGDSVNYATVPDSVYWFFSSFIEFNDTLLIAAQIRVKDDPFFSYYLGSNIFFLDHNYNIIKKIQVTHNHITLRSLTKSSDNEFIAIASKDDAHGSWYLKFKLNGEIIDSIACSNFSEDTDQHRLLRLNNNDMVSVGWHNNDNLHATACLSKFNPEGETEFCEIYNLSFFTSATLNGSSENFYVAGNRKDTCRIYQLEYSGNIISQFTLNDSIYGTNIIYDNGSIYLAGYYSYPVNQTGVRFMKINADAAFAVPEIIGPSEITVSPNPAVNFVEFRFENPLTLSASKEKEIWIFNLLGEKIASLPVISESTIWDCRKINRGIYLFNFSSEGKTYTGKIIKQ